MIILSFCFFLLLFIVIGVFSFAKSQHNSADYLVAGRTVQPWLVGLSAVATANSGYMFTGMIGFTYVYGWSSVWLMIGWLAGDFIGSMFIHKKLRITSEQMDSHSFSGILSRWNQTDFRKLKLILSIIAILFLGSYAAAQFNAGSKALHVLFGWDISVGAIIGSVVVLLYCFAGGIRASIWTDAAQSMVMIVSMGILLLVSISEVGGLAAAHERLVHVKPGFMDWFPTGLEMGSGWGSFLWIAGWMFAGFGVVGQPHVMVRFMTLNDPKKIWNARGYYYGWYFLFYSLTIGVGLMAKLLLPEVAKFDAELALPILSMDLLPSILVGMMLAGLFAATMSTADSLILSCSATITHDLFPRKVENLILTKAGTVFVTAVALVIALFGDKSVFKLVLYSWGVLAAAFGPLLAVYCLNQKPNETLAILMVALGVGTSFLWIGLGYSGIIYEIAPAILMGFLVFGIGKQLGMTLDHR